MSSKLPSDQLVEYYVPLKALRQALMGDKEQPGLFAEVMGFKTGTTAIKGVHIANDLAQTVLKGRPAHDGELLSRVIRPNNVVEQNTDPQLRQHPLLGTAYAHAFPSTLGDAQIYALRHAIGATINFDGGMYAPRTGMASALVAYHELLGAEGFRRFGVGAFLARLLGVAGQEQLRRLFTDPSDPITRLLAPLCGKSEWRTETAASAASLEQLERQPWSKFDEALSSRLQQLLLQPLSKLSRLRALMQGFTFGLILRLLGIGRPDGRPLVLASVPLPSDTKRPAREEAVQTFSAGLALQRRKLGEALSTSPGVTDLLRRKPLEGQRCLRFLAAPELRAAADAAIEAALDYTWEKEEGNLYSPEEFIIALGRRQGFIMPRRDNGGWGKHLCLTPDVLETLVLMYVQPGQYLPWKQLWEKIAEELGLLVGVGEDLDRALLRQAGMLQLRTQALDLCSTNALELMVRRGLARRLPDEGAEVGGSLA